MSEPGNGEVQPIVSRENQQDRLSRWTEQGLSPTAVAAYGGSIDILKDILTTGKVPSYSDPDLLPYQQDLLSTGGHLYYFTPIFEKINEVRPTLAENIKRRDPHLTDTLSAPKVRNTARLYAMQQSIKNFFYNQTGRTVEPSDIYNLAIDVIPETFDAFYDETREFINPPVKSEILKERNQEIVDSLRRDIDPAQLEEILRSSLQRRGVILYFNQNIFANNKVYAGHESEYEFMVVSQQPLSTETISGIEISTAAEKIELGL